MLEFRIDREWGGSESFKNFFEVFWGNSDFSGE